MKRYDKLEEKFEYDKEVATELAAAMTELINVARRGEYLKDVIKRHGKLKKFLWSTESGTVIALHDIEDDHLKNILAYLDKHDREASPQLKAEARSRGLILDGDFGLAPVRQIAAISNTKYSDEDERWESELEIDF
jgi:hypothetical protein